MNDREIYDFLIASGMSPAGACGLMGNLYAESGLKFNALEGLCRIRLKEAGLGDWSNESYTAAVDNGYISFEEFIHPLPGKQYGYGLAQWTSPSRKTGLYNMTMDRDRSIADPETQMDYLLRELRGTYRSVMTVLCVATTVREASDIVLDRFEQPADRSEAVRKTRAEYGQRYYDIFVKGGDSVSVMIGHASISENGTINGKAGDQTTKEVCTRTWYSKPWDYMAIHPDPDVRERHAKAIEAACANDCIGYSQYGDDDRNTLNREAKKVGYDLAKITAKCNTDCSELQNVAAVASGAPGVTHAANGWTTSSMLTELWRVGYRIIQGKYIKSAAYCVRGAIYVKAGSHTVCGLTDGSKAAETLGAAGIQPDGTPDPIEPGWKRAADSIRWWYQYDDGNFPANDWAYLREETGNTCGWYLFDEAGYMLTGYQTDPKGRKVFLCPEPGIDQGKCMVTDDQGALRIAEWDDLEKRYRI